MKICPVGAKFFHADGRRGMTKLNVAFTSFSEAPKNNGLGFLSVNYTK